MKNLSKYYPLTLPGTAAASAVLFLFGRGYADSDYQSLFIAAVFFIILLILASAAYYFSGKYYLNGISFKSRGEVSTSSYEKDIQNIFFEERPPLFFRYSCAIKGRFSVTGKSFFYYNRFISDKNGIIRFSYNFKSPGLLNASLYYYLEDIFGLFRIACSPPEVKKVRSVPGLPDEVEINRKDSLTSYVKNKKPDENDYEKILMREYMSGDRSRDINWKASSKSNTIYTRIAPGNDNQIKKINLVYCSDPGLFDKNTCRGFLVFRYFREYFRFLINNLFSTDNYKFIIYINGEKISADDRRGLESVYRELALPELRNDFEKSIHEEEGSFIVFCENPQKIEEIKSVFSNASGVKFFYPQIVNPVKSLDKSGSLKEFKSSAGSRPLDSPGEAVKIQGRSGYRVNGSSFSTPGNGIYPGLRFFRDMRYFYKSFSSNYEYTLNESDARSVEIVI